MPELYLASIAASGPGDLEKGRVLQNEACRIIYRMCTADCNLYAVLKEIIRLRGGPDAGDVRRPLTGLTEADRAVAAACAAQIEAAVRTLA
jgi:N-acetylneuraminate lyase